jgi:hypothetical protein
MTFDQAKGFDFYLGGRRSSITGSLARTGIPYAVTSATHDANNRLTSWGGTPLNMTGDVAHGYAWDARNHLTQIGDRSFSHDALGRRVNKNIQGASTSRLDSGVSPAQWRNNPHSHSGAVTPPNRSSVLTHPLVRFGVRHDKLRSSFRLCAVEHPVAPLGFS